jgi:urease accessory protein
MHPIPGALALLQFGDSMFPVGGFSFSNGLESAVEEGVVQDLDSLAGFVRNAVHQAATCDAIAVLEAHRGAQRGEPDRVRRADAAVYARKLNEEMRTMTVRMGHKLAEASVRVAPSPGASSWLRDINDGTTPGTHPVGVGVVLADLGLPETDAFAAHQYGVAVMMVGAATRLMRLHHLDAQAVLYEAGRTAPQDYDRIAESSVEEMATFAPTADILAGVHVGSFVRMFMN